MSGKSQGILRWMISGNPDLRQYSDTLYRVCLGAAIESCCCMGKEDYVLYQIYLFSFSASASPEHCICM